MYVSIRQKLMILAMLATVGYALSFIVVKSYHLHNMAHEEQRLKLESVAGIYLQFVAQYQHLLTQEARSVATLPALRTALLSSDFSSDSLSTQLTDASLRSVSRLLVLSADGDLLYGDDIFSGSKQSIRYVDGIHQTLEGHRYYGTSLIGGKFYQLATAPVLAEQTLVGAVVIAVPVLQVSAFQALSRVTGMDVALQYRDYLLGLSSAMDKSLAPGFLELLPRLSAGLVGEYLTGEASEVAVDGAEYLVIPMTLGNKQRMLIYSRKGELSAPFQRMSLLILFWGALSLAIGVVFSLWAARLIARPIEAITTAAREFGAGDISARANWVSNDEFGQLGQAFDGMADHIQQDRAELVAKREAAEAASQAKSNFLATMSHEIRTPLNGVLGMAQMVSNGIDDPRQQHNLAVMMQSGRDLLDVIDGILDFSKIEANKLRLSVSRFNLRQFMLELCDNQATLARNKGLGFKTRLAPDIDVAIEADPIWLRRILINLVGNAIKFTREGHVEVMVEVLDKSPGVSTFEFSVHDTGIGISPERLGVIFDSFAQADDSTTREYGGSGLGLAICRHLVELMGGSIDVNSTEGSGTCFTFTLAFKAFPASDVSPREAGATGQLPLAGAGEDVFELTGDYNFSGRKVLVVEDSELNAEIAKAMIERIGCEVQVAESGAVALDKLRDDKFDLVFMDCQMPVMDGLETTRMFRDTESGTDVARTPIVAFTAGAMSGNRELCRQAGMDDYITKPVTEKQLEDVLKTWLVDTAEIA